MLDDVGRDLTRLAAEGKLSPLFGRQNELLQLQRILLRKQKSNPLLVGAPGVGKTALVEGLASLIARGDATPELAGCRIVEIVPVSLVAGTAYRGTFEVRMQALVSEAVRVPNLILFVDEIHTLVRAGAVEGGALDAANILKPALARGDIRCIGASTLGEYDKFLKSDPAFERRFELMVLEEPTESEAIEILMGVLPAYEEHHHLRILAEAVEASVNLASRHILDRRLPDKAFDLLDAACTLVRLPSETPSESGPACVGRDAVTQALAAKLHIPTEKLGDDMGQKLAGLEVFLNGRVIGQPLAMARISAAILNGYAGLGNPTQPRCVFAFFGNSGVGKTATAKALAESLFSSPDALIRLDMSEFKEPHTVSRLLGAPPGYIGYDNEGTFATCLRRQPFSIVLIDEFEKAHPQICDVFLQIFDEGRFTDARGRLVEARHAIFILTSNLFSLEQIGSTDEYEQHASALRQSLCALLRPELVNRINEIVLFRGLIADDLVAIAQLEISGLNARLATRDMKVTADETALRWLADTAMLGNGGARAVIRLVSQYIAEPVSRLIVTTGMVSRMALHATVVRDRVVLCEGQRADTA